MNTSGVSDVDLARVAEVVAAIVARVDAGELSAAHGARLALLGVVAGLRAHGS